MGTGGLEYSLQHRDLFILGFQLSPRLTDLPVPIMEEGLDLLPVNGHLLLQPGDVVISGLVGRGIAIYLSRWYLPDRRYREVGQ